MEPGPEPGHVHDLQVLLAELPYQKRLPDRLIHAIAAPAPHPGIGRRLLERLPARRKPEIGADEPETEGVDNGIVAGEELQDCRRRIKRFEFTVVINDGGRALENDVVAPAELIDEAEDCLIAGEPVVV